LIKGRKRGDSGASLGKQRRAAHSEAMSKTMPTNRKQGGVKEVGGGEVVLQLENPEFYRTRNVYVEKATQGDGGGTSCGLGAGEARYHQKIGKRVGGGRALKSTVMDPEGEDHIDHSTGNGLGGEASGRERATQKTPTDEGGRIIPSS